MSKQSTVSPIDDLTFDVITVLREKAQALAAYDRYLRDADAEDDDELHELFLSMRKQDEDHVQVLKEVLARRLEDDLGYEDEDEDDTDDDEEIVDEIPDEDDLGEDYDEEDVDAVEEPSSAASSSSATATRGDDAAVTPSVPSAPRRGESTHRHR